MSRLKFFTQQNLNRVTVMFKMAATVIFATYLILLIAVGPFTLRLRTGKALAKEAKNLDEKVAALEKEKISWVKKVAREKDKKK